jgi:hypothetical protein
MTGVAVLAKVLKASPDMSKVIGVSDEKVAAAART